MSDYFLESTEDNQEFITIIGDEAGRIAGWASAGPCNHVGAAEGRTKFLASHRGVLFSGCNTAGLGGVRPKFKAACMGMSGGPEDKAALWAGTGRRRAYSRHARCENRVGRCRAEGEPGVVATCVAAASIV